MTKCVKTDDILLSLTSALDMSLPRANPDVCDGASVGAGGSYGDKALTSKWYICCDNSVNSSEKRGNT